MAALAALKSFVSMCIYYLLKIHRDREALGIADKGKVWPLRMFLRGAVCDHRASSFTCRTCPPLSTPEPRFSPS